MTPEETLIGLGQRDVPHGTCQRAVWHVLDWLGISLAARHTPQAIVFERYAGLEADALVGEAVGIAVTRPADAAFLLGGLGNILEMDDLHNASIMHAGNTVIPTVLTTALGAGTNGPKLLAAIARGYEVALRVGESAGSGGYRPFMNSVACGVFGAAYGAADVLGLCDEQRGDTLAQAGMMASGIWQCRLEPGFSKQVASANAARAGVDAARLAAAGMTGPKRVLSGKLGFLAAFYPEADPAAMTRDADGAWKLHEISFKPYPACRHTHPAIDAALEIAAGLEQHIDGIDEIAVSTYGAAIEFCDNPNPENADEARFSLQHAVAVALLRGAPEIDDFGPKAIGDAQIADLRSKVTLACDDKLSAAFPQHLRASLRATFSGQTLEATTDHAFGDPENPMSEADLSAKFHRNAEYAGLLRSDADRIEQAVHGLPDARSLDPLRGAIAAAFSDDFRPRVAL